MQGIGMGAAARSSEDFEDIADPLGQSTESGTPLPQNGTFCIRVRPLRVNEIRLVELKSTIDENKLKEKFHSSEELMERYVRPADSLARAAMDAKAMAWFYGEILRDRRKELKMSQAALVEKAGAKQSYIARIEKGEVDMQLSSLIRIAGALRLNLQLQ